MDVRRQIAVGGVLVLIGFVVIMADSRKRAAAEVTRLIDVQTTFLVEQNWSAIACNNQCNSACIIPIFEEGPILGGEGGDVIDYEKLDDCMEQCLDNCSTTD